MKYILLLLVVSSIFLNANEVKEKEAITNKNIEKQIQKEKKYTKICLKMYKKNMFK